MDKKNWLNQYKRPEWQKKRLEIMERDGWKCLNCETKQAMLSVHHQWYEKGKEMWEYPDNCYRTLCSECHEYEHDLISGFFPYFREIFFKNGWEIHEIEPLLTIFESKYSGNLSEDVKKYWQMYIEDLREKRNNG